MAIILIIGILFIAINANAETRGCGKPNHSPKCPHHPPHSPPPTPLPVEPGLVGQYHLDSGEGLIAFDSSGLENDGILGPSRRGRQPIWIEGVYGTALSFSHNHSMVSVPHDYTLNLTDLSISAWIRTDSNKAKRMIVCKSKNFSCKSGGYAFCVSPPGRKGKGRLGFWSSGNNRWVRGNSRVDDGLWHHVMVILEGNDCYFYIDGELDAVAASAPPRPNNKPLLIGAWNCGNVAFDGDIDEVNIYNCAIPEPNWRDIVINEVNYSGDSSDPLFPEVRFEYIELYNRGDIPVTLDGWFMMDRAVDLYTFPSGEEAIAMPPKSFLVIFSSAAEGIIAEDLDLSDGSGRVIAGPEWTEYELRDTGDSIQIYSSTVLDAITIVDFVAYDEHNEQKFPELDDIAVAAGIWTDNEAVDTLSPGSSHGRALYLINDGETPHEISGNDEEDLDWNQYKSDEGGTPGAPNPPATPAATPTPALTPPPTPVPTPSSMPDYLIDEGFDGFHLGTRPAGWTFTGCNNDSDTYVSLGNFGDSLPSLKLDATGDVIVTETFSYGTSLSFWLKGFSTGAVSHLLVEENIGSVWTEITDIADLPTSGTRIESLSLNPSSSQQVRFSYTKTSGNLALDDVRIDD